MYPSHFAKQSNDNDTHWQTGGALVCEATQYTSQLSDGGCFSSLDSLEQGVSGMRASFGGSAAWIGEGWAPLAGHRCWGPLGARMTSWHVSRVAQWRDAGVGRGPGWRWKIAV